MNTIKEAMSALQKALDNGCLSHNVYGKLLFYGAVYARENQIPINAVNKRFYMGR